MAFDFPSSPTVGQEYTSGAITYVWNGYGWNVKLPQAFIEAPVNGKIYGRKDAVWAEVISDVTKAYVDAEVAKRVLKAGDQMSGSLYIRAAPATISVNTLSGESAIYGHKNDKARWRIDLADAAAELGSNVGSNLLIHRFDDAEVYIDTPFRITRSTGNAIFSGALTAAGGLAMSTNVAAVGNDLSKHLSLYGNSYGLSVTSSTLNLVAGGAATVQVTAALVTVPALTVTGSEALRCVTTSANHARMRFIVSGVRDWSIGTVNWGIFYIADESAGAERMTIGTGGNVNINVSLSVVGAITSGTLSTGRIDSSIVYFGSGIYWNHEAGNARLASNQNVYSYGYVNAAAGMRCEGTFVTAANAWVHGGVLYMSAGGHYFQWDGSNYVAPHGDIYIRGARAARHGEDVTFGNITANSNVDSGASNYFFAHNAGIYWRWRGDLGKLEASHTCIMPNIETGAIYCSGRLTNGENYQSKHGGNGWHFHWSGNPGLNAYVDNGDWGNVLNVQSDYRLKKDVTPLHSMWDVVKAMRPIKYTASDWAPYSKPDGIEQWGLIAHELQETLIPSVSTGHKDWDGAPQQPNPMVVLTALTKALQEAMSRIEQLEERIAHA